MDATASTPEAKYPYSPKAWPPATGAASNSKPPQQNKHQDQQPTSPTVPFPTHLDFLPLWFPQQSNIFQAQLLHYNTLISPTRGGGLQAAPLPPVVSASNAQASPRSRTSSKAAQRDTSSSGKGNTTGGNGSRSRQNSDKNRTGMTNKETSTKMPPPPAPKTVTDSTKPTPLRQPTISSSPKNQSYASSVPSTPHQHARKFSFESRDPSPNAATNHSPRSVYSETNSALPSLRPLPPRLGGCKYETSQINSRRRIPYSVGSDRLEKLDLRTVKNKLSAKDEDKLGKEMRDIYNKLLPTDEIENNRKALVEKLEKIFNDEWPGHDIKVHLFGSSGNLLCSDDSDVDICITTPWQELEGVCMIADLLARRGMEKVVCISAAKVPIVKMWDPELSLACDMNVNNTLALENTRMVRTYVEADPRVRQLAMTIKHWTKRRIVNDAAFGGTLSSYTWICLIVAFLQLRSPPVLPALHQLPYKIPKADGTVGDFADNLKKIEGYGAKNKSSEADLLFQFFRFYAHEFDYDKHVLSVRGGKLMTKAEKKWNYALNNQLCVEEPFNVSRNLGNTADEYSFRGLHLELRRAFDLISQAKLEEACEQFVFPKEEERVWSRPAPQPRPVLLRSSSQSHSGRGGRGNHRGGRHNNNNNYRGGGNGGGNGNSNRRSSSSVPAYDANMFMQPVNMAQDMMWYQSPQIQFQYAQQDLMTQMAYQESLRQFYAQSPAFAMHQNMGQQRVSTSSSSGQQSTDRSRTNSFDTAPTSAPLRPDLYAVYSMSLGHGFYPPSNTGYGTYPSSPIAGAGSSPDFRRSLQRSGAGSDAGGQTSSSAMRSQSQPASRSVSAAQLPGMYPLGIQQVQPPFLVNKGSNGTHIPSFISDDMDFDETPKASADSPASEDNKSQSFFPPRSASPVKSNNTGVAASGNIAFGDITSHATNTSSSGRPPVEQTSQATLDKRTRKSSRSPSPLGHSRAFSVGTASASAPLPSAPFSGSQSRTMNRPLVVNGSGLKPAVTSENSNVHTAEPFTSHEASLPMMMNGLNIQTPYFTQKSQATVNGSQDTVKPDVQAKGQRNGNQPTPVSGPRTGPRPVTEDASFRDRIAMMNGPYYAAVAGQRHDSANGEKLAQVSTQQRLANRQQQGGIIAPLDLAGTESKPKGLDMAHLSPVLETRTPSPAKNRSAVESFKLNGKKLGDRRDETKTDGHQLPKGQKGQTSGAPFSTTPRGNGHIRAAKSEGDGGWQKAGKGKKKSQVQPTLAEQPPKYGSERKGG